MRRITFMAALIVLVATAAVAVAEEKAEEAVQAGVRKLSGVCSNRAGDGSYIVENTHRSERIRVTVDISWRSGFENKTERKQRTLYPHQQWELGCQYDITTGTKYSYTLIGAHFDPPCD